MTGRPEVWQVLRAALEVLWEADLRRAAARDDGSSSSSSSSSSSEDVDDDDVESRDDDDRRRRRRRRSRPDADESLATAQSILRAAEVTLPTGDLSNGAYDSLGNHYHLPEWIVSDPVNVAEDSGAFRAAAATAGDRKVGGGEDDDDLDGGRDPDEEAALRRREEKGKAVANVRNMVKVCARLSENARDVTVRAGPDESVRSVARKVVEDSGVSLPRPVYLGYFLTPPSRI